MAMKGRGERRRWPALLLVVLAFTVIGVVFDGSRVAGPHLHQLHRRGSTPMCDGMAAAVGAQGPERRHWQRQSGGRELERRQSGGRAATL
uniref:Uncharacterized protein n=1 Tax=Oryza rufipogon TaxID=4529 RepID=A0A0E0N1L9_ORYRU